MKTRRTFMKAGMAGAASLLFGSKLRAQASPNRKLVIALAYGGWDATWLMDPKPDARDVDFVPGDVRMFGDLPLWVHANRPNVTRFFERWGSLSAVVNGVSVESLAHETCADTMLTGRPGGKTPDLGARVAQLIGAERPLPYMALGAQAEVVDLESYAGKLGDTNQIMALATREFQWPEPGRAQSDARLVLSASEQSAVRNYLRRSADVLVGQGGGPRRSRRVDDYAASLHRAHQLVDSARAGGVLSDYQLFEEVEAPWKHIARALAEDVSQVALVQPNLYWDTHDWNGAQGDAYETFFGGLDSLLQELSDNSVIDDTVVLVLSEMGRTPLHNASGGKDHWPWTSAIVIGSRVNGGRAFGSTDEWLRPAKVDLTTGQASDSGVLLHAGHVLGGTAAALGIRDTGWYEEAPLDALVG